MITPHDSSIVNWMASKPTVARMGSLDADSQFDNFNNGSEQQATEGGQSRFTDQQKIVCFGDDN